MNSLLGSEDLETHPPHHAAVFMPSSLHPPASQNQLNRSSSSPDSILAYQQPNAKKLRRIAEKAERLAAKGVVPRKQKRLLNRRPIDRTVKKAVAEANNNPDRDYYDIWGQEREWCVCVGGCVGMCV